MIDQYSTFCRHFAGGHSSFYTFNYDWRRDLNETTDKLIMFLEDIRSSHGSVPQVISHSIGCLILLAALKERPSISQCFVCRWKFRWWGRILSNEYNCKFSTRNQYKNRMGSMFILCANYE